MAKYSYEFKLQVVQAYLDGEGGDMVMDVSFVNVRREYILMLPLCYRVGKLLSDFMGFLIIYFPQLKGLYQMKG